MLKTFNGYWINLNFNIPQLIKRILSFCLHCGYTEEQIVIYGVPKEDMPYKKEDLSLKNLFRDKFDIVKAEDFLNNVGLNGATIDEIISVVQPGALIYQTADALNSCLNVIFMPGNRYVHVNSFVDLDEAEEIIQEILQTHFRRFGGYSNNKLLFGAAEHDLSMFLNDNNCADIDSVYALAQYFFNKKAIQIQKYKFSYPHIFEQEPDYPINLKGLMINLARMNNGILNTESAKEYLQNIMLTYGSMGQLLQIASSNTFLIYDTSCYVLSEKLCIDKFWVQSIHDRLDNLFRQENVAYIIPRDINFNWLSSLPELSVELPWTLLLLQEVIKKYPDIGFKVILTETNQTYDTIAAAFVPANSPLQSFADVVTLFMQEHYELPKRMSCEDLRIILREAGMLQRNELLYSLPKALKDYRFSWTDNNKTVLVRGN